MIERSFATPSCTRISYLPETPLKIVTDIDDDEELLVGQEDTEDADTDIPNPDEFDAYVIRWSSLSSTT